MNRIFFYFLILPLATFAQTNTLTSGNWSDGSVWSTGAAPLASATVNANHPVIINTNITITTGTYNFYQNVTDLSGGTAYTITANTSGGTLDIKGGVTTFEGAASFDNSTLFVRSGATLILGATTLGNQSQLTVEAGGTLIINGNLTNNNNGIGTFSIAGLVQVNGDYSAAVGSVSVSGSGEFFTTGTITTTGSSEVFGSIMDCGAGPCSGRNLCNFTPTDNSAGSNQTLCSGSTPAPLAGSNVTGTTTYLWESSTTSSTAGFAAASGTNNAQNYSPPALTLTTWYRRSATRGGCTGITPPIKITIVPSSGGWKPANTNWNLNTNWCDNTVPTSTTDVVISTSAAFMPQITAAANCRNLTIDGSASVTINGSNSLSVFGNLTNNGSLVTNTSTVTLNGTTQQTVSGNPIMFNNLTINNSAGTSPQVTINSFVTIASTLTMTQGMVSLSGYNVTLGQSAASPGTLSYTAGRFINGNMTRWFNTSAISIGDVAGRFPVGSTADYRPFHVGYALLTTGGTIRVGFTQLTNTTSVNFTDGSPPNVILSSNAFWRVATGNGIATTGTFDIRAQGSGLVVTDINHLHLIRKTDVTGIGTKTASGGTTTDPLVNRTLVPLAGLNNNFHVGSNDASSYLPISLISFSGKFIEQGVQLEWSTASQENFDYFQVERSANGLDFAPIHQRSGEAYSTSIINYSFLDAEVKNGKYYYRLKNVDRDGTFDFSRIILLEKKQHRTLSIYPNPASTHEGITVSISGEQPNEVTVGIYDLVGKMVKQYTLIQNEIQIPTQEMTPGIYFVKVNMGSEFFTSRLVVR